MPVTVTTPTTIIVSDSAARGPVGPQGPIGLIGAMFFYTFDANTSTDVAPANGHFHCDHPDDQESLTKLWLSNYDLANANIGGAIVSIFNSDSTPKGHLSIRGRDPGHERILTAVNDITLKEGYFEIDVDVVAYSVSDLIDNLDTTGFNFSVTGNTGGDVTAAYAQANAAYIQANTARNTSNNAYGQANTARTTANDAYGVANSAYVQANAAYNAANSISWVSVPGSKTAVGTAGDAAYDITGVLYVCVATNTWAQFTGVLDW